MTQPTGNTTPGDDTPGQGGQHDASGSHVSQSKVANATSGGAMVPGNAMSVADMRAKVIEALESRGAQVEQTPDGLLSFMDGQHRINASMREDKPGYLEIFGSWKLGDDVPGDATARLAACNEVSLTLACVKLGMYKDILVVTSDHVLAATDDVDVRVAASVVSIREAHARWAQELAKE